MLLSGAVINVSGSSHLLEAWHKATALAEVLGNVSPCICIWQKWLLRDDSLTGEGYESPPSLNF